jgi:hypothetical protein
MLAEEPNAVAIEAVRRLKGADLSANPALKRAVDKMVDEVRGQGVMVELIRDFDLKDRVPQLVDYLRKHPGDEAALDAVSYIGVTDASALKEELQAAGVAVELIRTVGRSGRTEWTTELVRLLAAADRTPAQREAAVAALLSRCCHFGKSSASRRWRFASSVISTVHVRAASGSVSKVPLTNSPRKASRFGPAG